MRILLFIFVFFVSIAPLNAQVMQFDWAKGFIGSGNATPARLVMTDSSNLVIAGGLYSWIDFDPGVGVEQLGSSNSSGFLAMYDSVGNYKWAINSINFNGGLSGFNGFDVDQYENTYVAGVFNNKVDLDPGPDSAFFTPVGGGYFDFFLAKYDANGNYLWAISGGDTAVSPYDEHEAGRDVAVDANGNVYFVGTYSFTTDFDPGPGVVELAAEGGEDIFICKYDSAGNFQWVKSVGGPNKDWVRHVSVAGNGDIIISGYYTINADFDPSAGTAILDTDYGNSGSVFGFFTARYDANGNYLWAVTPTGSNINECNVNDMVLDSSGNIILTGSYYGNDIDFDPSSSAGNGTNDGWGDFFIVKYDPNGNYLWSFVDGGAGTDGMQGLAVDPMGNMYVSIQFQDSVDVDPSAGVYTIVDQSTVGTVLAKYSPTGQLLFAESFDPIGMQGIVIDADDRITLSGVFYQPTDFDLSANDSILTPNGYNCYLARYNHGVFLGQPEFSEPSNLWKIYPNPSTGNVVLNSIEPSYEMVKVVLYTTLGKSVFKQQFIDNGRQELDFSHFSPGHYLLKVVSQEKSTVLPLIIAH
jgi:hypothetical protein